ncbi:uncharacterized protein RHO25_004110 [Cercospora beticola]|nr:hypothetical protein RHO25_004110 [Cercospora beticola]
MDLQAWAPKWLNIRRGAYIIAAIGIAVNPWQLTVNAQTFIAVLNGFGNFYGPCSGILVTDFWIVRKRLIKMDDLYRGNSASIYWYYKGFNWRAYAAFLIGVIPAMPGYVTSVSDLDRAPNSAMKLSRLGFLTGFFISSLTFWFLSTILPPPGIGHGTKAHNEDELILPTGYRQDCPTQGKYSVPIDGVTLSRESESEKREEVYDRGEGLKGSVITKV